MPNDRFETARKNSQKRLYEAARSVEAEAEEVKAKMASQAERAVEGAISDTETALSALRERAASQVEAVDRHLSKSEELLENLQEVHRVSTETALGGSHDETALAEREAAHRWHKRSIVYRWCTVGAAIGSGVFNALVPAEGWEWALRSPFGAGVAFLAWMAKYASDQGDDHRTASLIFKHQSLAVPVLGPLRAEHGRRGDRGTIARRGGQPRPTVPRRCLKASVHRTDRGSRGAQQDEARALRLASSRGSGAFLTRMRSNRVGDSHDQMSATAIALDTRAVSGVRASVRGWWGPETRN